MNALQSLIVSARSWKSTTIGTVFGGVVAWWAFADPSLLTVEQAIGLLAIGLAGNGLVSRDGNLSSENVGVNQ